MTNAEIRAAVLRIVQIKGYKEEEKKLRQSIIREMNKRRKQKLDLGGPNREDYICLRSSDYIAIRPEALLTYLEDKATEVGFPSKSAWPTFFKCIKVQVIRLREVFGRNEADHIRSTVKSDFLYSQDTLTYKISTDDNNQVRGIDL